MGKKQLPIKNAHERDCQRRERVTVKTATQNSEMTDKLRAGAYWSEAETAVVAAPSHSTRTNRVPHLRDGFIVAKGGHSSNARTVLAVAIAPEVERGFRGC